MSLAMRKRRPRLLKRSLHHSVRNTWSIAHHPLNLSSSKSGHFQGSIFVMECAQRFVDGNSPNFRSSKTELNALLRFAS